MQNMFSQLVDQLQPELEDPRVPGRSYRSEIAGAKISAYPAELVPPWPGPPNCVWFQVLKLSARNSIRLPRSSLRVNSLNRDRFQLLRPGPRRESKPRFPQVPAAGAANALESNHWSTVFGCAMRPRRSGRL